MAQKRSKVSRFKSPSTGEYCTIAQYIAEILIQRKAEKENLGSLSYKFWNKAQKKSYATQIQAVSKLINKFGERQVYDYIVNKNKKVYSALPKWVKDAVSQHRTSLEKPIDDTSELENIDINQRPRRAFGAKNLFSRLRPNNDKKE